MTANAPHWVNFDHAELSDLIDDMPLEEAGAFAKLWLKALRNGGTIPAESVSDLYRILKCHGNRGRRVLRRWFDSGEITEKSGGYFVNFAAKVLEFTRSAIERAEQKKLIKQRVKERKAKAAAEAAEATKEKEKHSALSCPMHDAARAVPPEPVAPAPKPVDNSPAVVPADRPAELLGEWARTNAEPALAAYLNGATVYDDGDGTSIIAATEYAAYFLGHRYERLKEGIQAIGMLLPLAITHL